MKNYYHKKNLYKKAAQAAFFISFPHNPHNHHPPC